MESFKNEITSSYKGLDYIVRLYPMGYRCGYVKVPESLNDDKFYENGTLLVHGGVTFEETIGDDDTYLPPGHWIGFDCAHCGDGMDIAATLENFGKEPDYPMSGKVWGTEQVESECKSVIDQLVKLTEE